MLNTKNRPSASVVAKARQVLLSLRLNDSSTVSGCSFQNQKLNASICSFSLALPACETDLIFEEDEAKLSANMIKDQNSSTLPYDTAGCMPSQ